MTLKMRGRLDAEQSRQLLGLLGNLARVGDDAVVGQMHVLDLGSVAEELALAAPDKLRSLADLALKVLAERVHDPDIFYQQTETRFAMIFVNADEGASEAKLGSVRQEIVERLRGEHGVEAQVGATKVGAAQLLKESQEYFAQVEDYAAAERETALAPGERLDLSFRPLWRASNDGISLYMMSARKLGVDGQATVGYSALNGREDVRKVAAYDVTMLRLAEDELKQGIEKRESFSIATPVFYPSFSDPLLTRMYRNRLEALPDEVRRRLCLQLIGVNSRADSRKLMVNLNVLSTYCKAVMMQFPLRPVGYIDLKASRLGILGTSVYGLEKSDAALRLKLENFTRMVSAFDAPLYLTGVETEEIATLALELGFEYLSGPFVAADMALAKDAFTRPFHELAGASAPEPDADAIEEVA